MYADDNLVYLSYPSESFSSLMKLLDKFGEYVGYKLNIKNTNHVI